MNVTAMPGRNGRTSFPALALGFGAALSLAGIAAFMLRSEPSGTEGAQPTGRPPAAASDAGNSSAPPEPSGAGESPVAPKSTGTGAGDSVPARPRLTAESLDRIVRGQDTVRAKMAALKSAWKSRLDPELKAFRYILTENGVNADLRRESVEFLVEKASVDPKARAILEEYARTHGSDDLASVQAMGAVLRYGTDDEITRCTDRVLREPNVDAVAAQAHALAANKSSSAQSLLSSLANTHPDPEARHRAEEERTGQFCPDHQPMPDEATDTVE